jgi:hypothetical protein
MTGEHDTTDSNDMEASMAETRRGKWIVHVIW